ncbi:MAG: protein-ADP-ribose hydrolase [Clostridia bacterium]|nr:protein-ADP-ribose hydrolase [Clostridia bacterium]
MTQEERRLFLIRALLCERPDGDRLQIPADTQGQKDLLRALMNVRQPLPLDAQYLEIERAYLQQEIAAKGVTTLDRLTPLDGELYLWQGDITTLECDAIVNAANSALLGCFQPLHNCIDNCIHTFAGLALRNACDVLMQKQGYAEPTGQAKITPGFNLPCKYVLHTVGPIVSGKLTDEHCRLLASCYRSCLSLAEAHGCESIAFCCISTGVFGFPQQEAAEIAVRTVKAYKEKTYSKIKVIFNVFKDEDDRLYRHILTEHRSAQTRAF